MLHHIATISLIGLSYLTSFTRIGATIFLTHDIADIFLESAKCINYTARTQGRKHLSIYCDILFGIFAISFFITRLILYPRYMVWSLVYEAPLKLGGYWLGYYAFAGLLILLQILHIFWFYLIVRMIYKLITTGIDKDVRSDDEDCLEEEAYESPKNMKKLKKKEF
jgi:ceramide synthetase